LGIVSRLYALRYLSLVTGYSFNSSLGFKKMKVFGISVWTIFIVIAALIIGKKYPGTVAKIPLVGNL
jgi:hypothetical protein